LAGEGVRINRHGPVPQDRGPRINEQIRISPIRLIGAQGEQLGIVPTSQAMEMAREANLDLVEVAPMERPPVCKIMDYGKFRYQQSKKKSDKSKVHQQ
jgi:translation initiation factor IF-3